MSGRPHTLVRIIVVGDSYVGKTRLLRQFVDGEARDEHETTIGVDYMDKNITVDDTSIYLQLWDTAGQERFRALTTSFYMRAQGAVVVYDVTDRTTFEHVRQWITEVQSNVPKDIPMVICGNKADCVSERQVQASEAKQLAQQLNCLHFETSARTGANIEQMFISLARMAYRDVPTADANAKQVVDVTPTPTSSCC